MFKRVNKITSLLVAAAAVISIVPATGVDAADRLETKDGTIGNAIAYADGKYVYEGYKNEDEDQGIYYNDGSEDKSLDDLSDADLNTTYQDKYAFANDGEDQYLVNLTNGDVVDEDTPEDTIDNAASKLQTKLKKTDRYGSDISIDEESLGYDSSSENLTSILPGSKYGDSWYSYKVKLGTEADSANNEVTENDGNKYLYGFTNGTGKYIDISNVANIYAYSTAKGKMVKIEEFSNNVEDADDSSQLLTTLLGQPVVLTQDKDYIYTLTTVAITDTAAGAKVTGGTTTSSAAIVGTSSDDVTTIRTYIQKISKEQGDQKDEAYLPKTVVSYELGNKDGAEFDCDDAKNAYTAITDVLGNDLTSVTQEDVVLKSSGQVKPLFTIADGKLTVINISTSNVKATTINFKKDKIEFASSSNVPTDFDVDDKLDVYFAEKDDSDDVDLDIDSTDNLTNAYDVDVDGNLWVIADGKIYKFTNNEMTKTYTTDSSLDQISVYNENSLIAWQADGDIYTTVSTGKSEDSTNQTENTSTEVPTTTPVKTGWSQLADGTWNFYDVAGTKVTNNWVNDGGVWYYMKADGVMATGWIQDGATWYYLNGSGAMKTGWIIDNGTWYYLNASGAMQTGWINDNGTWYYLSASGAMISNTIVDGYRLGASGAWIR